MIFITGPLFAGKKSYIKRALRLDDEALSRIAVWDVQELAADAEDLEALADQLTQYPIVIATEVGAGVVPIDPVQRAQREDAGRLACLLAQHADTVVRVCCGLPQLLKGEWPC
ncbi:MAG: bifunctional adenosylcobinamide kinase/adenosylcobinamide-phosphate guanylyltransferase [Oscillospiraceae bacterium]|jgi:adenosylcobinamide kinase/adenosylcobinamide-phosphate guanylyltransferase